MAQQFGFRLEVVEIGHDEDGDPVTSCVAVASGVAPPTAKRITGAASIALRLLHNAIINAGEALPACTHIPPSVLAVRMELWRRYCDSGQVSDGDTPDAKRKAFKRAAARLQEISAIGVWGDWVWLADPDIKRTCPDTVRARKGRETGRTRTPPYRVSVVRPPSQWPNRSCVKLSRTKMDTPPLRLETGAEAAAYTTTFRVGRKCRVTVTITGAPR